MVFTDIETLHLSVRKYNMCERSVKFEKQIYFQWIYISTKLTQVGQKLRNIVFIWQFWKPSSGCRSSKSKTAPEIFIVLASVSWLLVFFISQYIEAYSQWVMQKFKVWHFINLFTTFSTLWFLYFWCLNRV